jgi:hypothetical protein
MASETGPRLSAEIAGGIPESRLVVVAGSGHLTCGHRNIAAALRRNARDATRLLPLFGITSR